MNEDRRVEVETRGAPAPVFAYSQGIRASGLLFVSGQGPVDAKTGEVPREFAGQVRRALDNVAAIAVAAGASLRDAVRVGVYLADGGDFEVMDAVYREYFHEPFPARTTVVVSLQGIGVEIDAVIVVGGAG